MNITEVTPECVRAELLVRKELGNRNGVLHGGASWHWPTISAAQRRSPT